VVKKNFAAVDAALAHLHEVKVPASSHGSIRHAAGRFRQRARFRANVLGR
jgi:hypothetical protein